MIDSREYDVMARNLLEGKGLTNPVGFIRPPLYPLFVAVCYSVGGIQALQSAQVLISAATVVLIGKLGEDLAGNRGSGWCAGMMAAVYPWSFQWIGGLASETLFTFLAVAAFLAVVKLGPRADRPQFLVAGLVFAAASLARANLLVVLPPLVMWMRFHLIGSFRPALFVCGVVMGLLPFTAYNWMQGNGLVVGSTGGGVVFYVGNNPDTALLYGNTLNDDEWDRLSRGSALGRAAHDFAGCPSDVPFGEFTQCTHDLPVSEREAFWYRAGLRYIVSDPIAWAQLEWRKILHFWRPWVEPRVYPLAIVLVSGVTFAVVLAFAIAALLIVPRRSAWFVIAVAVGSMSASVLWAVQLRYRVALLDPVLIAIAGASVWRLALSSVRRRYRQM